LSERIERHIRAGFALRADDTPVSLLDPGKGNIKTGQLWTAVSDERPFGSVTPPAAFADVIAGIADDQINRVDELLRWNWSPIPEQAKAARSARRSRCITLT
jgi:hypothetical protein